MEYFYTAPHLITPPDLRIDGDEFSHLTHVMRKSVGDVICVVDGNGEMYEATISCIEKRSARCTITERHARAHEPDRNVTLAVGILKNSSKFDFLVEKTTEVGVNTFVPLITERTIPNHARVDRWQKLCLAAMKQSGRCVLPAVRPLTSLPEFIRSIPPETITLIAHEQAQGRTVRDALGGQSRHSIALCIGPEGGFTDEEVSSAVNAGCIPVTLGQRRLRTETAAIVASTLALL